MARSTTLTGARFQPGGLACVHGRRRPGGELAKRRRATKHVAKTAFPAGQEATRTALLSLIDRRRARLQREALKLGTRVYGRRPKSFVRSVERRRQKRAAKQPEPIAG